MKLKNLYRTTDNLGVYNIVKKHYYENKSRIFCSFCKYHRGENRTPYNFCWKDTTKARKQWGRHHG